MVYCVGGYAVLLLKGHNFLGNMWQALICAPDIKRDSEPLGMLCICFVTRVLRSEKSEWTHQNGYEDCKVTHHYRIL